MCILSVYVYQFTFRVCLFTFSFYLFVAKHTARVDIWTVKQTVFFSHALIDPIDNWMVSAKKPLNQNTKRPKARSAGQCFAGHLPCMNIHMKKEVPLPSPCHSLLFSETPETNCTLNCLTVFWRKAFSCAAQVSRENSWASICTRRRGTSKRHQNPRENQGSAKTHGLLFRSTRPPIYTTTSA